MKGFYQTPQTRKLLFKPDNYEISLVLWLTFSSQFSESISFDDNLVNWRCRRKWWNKSCNRISRIGRLFEEENY
jgi:hypothetical protein